MSLSSEQVDLLVLIPRITVPLSIVGSMLILFVILKKTKVQWRSPYHRLLLAISFNDIIASFWYALGLVPVPTSTGQPGAKGTFATCQAQGFSLAMGVPLNQLYAVSLMIYFHHTICHHMTPEIFQSSGLEKLLHTISILIPLGIAILGLTWEVINWNGGSLCWIAASPPGCESFDAIPCERGGDHLRLFLWTCVVMPMIASLTIFVGTSVRIWWTVRTTVQRTATSAMTDATKRLQRQVTIQSILYGIAFANTYILIAFATTVVASGRYEWLDDMFPLMVVLNIFFPCQGLFNLLIFVRPRFQRVRSITLEQQKLYQLQKSTSSLSRTDNEDTQEDGHNNTKKCGCRCHSSSSRSVWRDVVTTFSHHEDELSRREASLRQQQLRHRIEQDYVAAQSSQLPTESATG